MAERLFLIRHGQTELNWAGRLQGSTDSPLTERGIEQAKAVGAKLKVLVGSLPVALWTSPLGRAQQTADIIAEHVTLSTRETDHRLAEIGLGAWEGMTMEDIEFTHPGRLDGAGRFGWAYRAPGGESREGFFARLADVLKQIETASTPIIAVSHGWAGMGLRSLYLNEPFEAVTAKGDSHEAVFEFSNGAIKEH